MQTSLASPCRTKQKRRLRWRRASTQRYPGQLFDSESGLHYNYFRDYEAGTGRYVESDPIGLAGGSSTYGYVKSNPLFYSDPRGLEGGSYYTNPEYRMAQPRFDGSYWGWEAQIGYGRGRTSFTCNDECGKSHTYIYKKVCYGASFGLGGGVGAVQGTDGKKCNAKSYEGWFLEGGLGEVVGVNFDIGFNEDGAKIPFYNHRFPRTWSGVTEGGYGAGVGWPAKLTWCYYTKIGEK